MVTDLLNYKVATIEKNDKNIVRVFVGKFNKNVNL